MKTEKRIKFSVTFFWLKDNNKLSIKLSQTLRQYPGIFRQISFFIPVRFI